MIDDEPEVVVEDDDRPPAARAEPTPVVPAEAGPGSILGSLASEVAAEVDDADEFKDLPVGKIARLYARYKALNDDEIEEINKLAKNRDRLRKRVGADEVDIEGTNQRSAILLARSCVTLLWRQDDGELVELHTALAAQGIEVDGVLRYDQRLIPMFEIDDVPPDANSVQIAMRLHRWGKDNNYSPLRSTAQLVELHSSGLSGEALEAALQGN